MVGGRRGLVGRAKQRYQRLKMICIYRDLYMMFEFLVIAAFI
jgi:hypothetical protein